MRHCQPVFQSPFKGRSDEDVGDESVAPGFESGSVDYRPVSKRAASAFRRATKPRN